MASRIDPQQIQKKQLQKRIENLAEKQMKSSLHARFLQNCIESECVPDGMLLKKKIYVGKDFSDLQKSVDNLLKKVSLDICERVKSAHQQKVRQIGVEIESLRDTLKDKSGDEGITEFDLSVFERTEAKKNSILDKQNRKLKSLQNKSRTPTTPTPENSTVKPRPKQKKKQNKKQNQNPKQSKQMNTSAGKQEKTKESDMNKPGKKPSKAQNANQTPQEEATKENPNQPKNFQTSGTKKTYAEAITKGAEVNVQETLVTILSSLKTLLENQRICPERETEDSSVKTTRTNGRRKRKGNKKFKEGNKQ